MKPSIVVVGSSNTDMVVKADYLPRPGETILGGTFIMNAGGKGANQAVAAARLGGNVTFIVKTGNDIFGQEAIKLFGAEGIDTSYAVADATLPSGVALIAVDANGENSIVVASGANAALTPADVQNASSKIESASLLLVQLETPLTTVEHAINLAAKNNLKVVLNPAPALMLSDQLLAKVSIITPNKTEAELLTGIKVTSLKTAEQAAKAIATKGVETVIVTLGAQGALVYHDNVCKLYPAPLCKAVDTTAAGDVFNGALAVAISEGKEIPDAVTFACQAAALSVCKLGAQSSAPYRDELDAALTAAGVKSD
jgi:ribokinase